MKKRVGKVEEFEFEPISESRQLHITIGVSGWLTEQMPGISLIVSIFSIYFQHKYRMITTEGPFIFHTSSLARSECCY